MHLNYKTSQYKGKTYKSYSIAESYREGSKVKKRIIWPIGKLTDNQAKRINFLCKMLSDPSKVITSIDDIVAQESKPFLDLAVASVLWDQWKFSSAFSDHTTDSELPTHIVAKILTINRCIGPCSHYSIPQWAQKTALSEVIGQSLMNLNDDKIYYELDKIAQNQQSLEDHLFRITYQKDKASYKFVNYDLSSSYFVGTKCELSDYGRSKDNKSHNKQVILGILINNKGYPFKWDVYPGNIAEVGTLVGNVDICRIRFNLKDITMVFDRGIVCGDNLDYISDKKLKYISALDKDQIPNIQGIDLSMFSEFNFNNFKEHLSHQHFTRYDDFLYFKDLGLIQGRRYVLGFNPVMFKEEKECRNEKIAYFEDFLLQKNEELKKAKRSRNYEITKQVILNELKRLKIKKYFHTPVLEKITVKKTNKKGQTRIVKSFHIKIERKTDIIAGNEKLDGLCVFVSNHIEKVDNLFLFPAENIIKAYRDKTKIEDVFKHIKSFLKIRPFYVNTDDHVRAVYTICVLAYFLNKDLAQRRKIIEGIDYLNSKNLYEPFRSCHYITIKDKRSHIKKSEPVELTSEQKQLLKELNIDIKIPKKICSP
jgi:transposase